MIRSALEEFKIQMWLVPKGVALPNFGSGTASLRIPLNKPFLISTDNDGICAPAPLDPVLSDLLAANPSGIVYAVLYGDSTRERRSELNKALKALARVPRSRVRYILRPSLGRFGADYWFYLGKPQQRAIRNW
jgi:hypothetical protein